ncbi:TonB-dependent receptor [Helicobacter sp. MIT 05-5293]|uniref:TonB-dependent receptor n=1 Tax=Helicobacter sp. MIT 05-5293 TaxID=1548149 RepID=UPI001F545C94|nr:TonB-dependent receptor [Helicobacter sp. MIT 05-5293]
MNITKIIRGGGALIVFLGANAYALEDSSKTYDLGRIEKVDSQNSKITDYNPTVTTITSEDIANSSSNNIAEALRFTPGMFYEPAAGSRGEPSIGIRGYSSTHIGLFIDGIPVHSVYDRQTDWSQFSSFGISEIDISKGYTSPIYGMNTLGGAVNIITSKPKDKLEIDARYGFVANNENQVNLSVGTNMGKWYAQASYAYTDRDSLNLSHNFKTTQLQPTKSDKINSNYTNHTLRAKVGWEPNENHEYSLNVIYQKGEKGGMISANGTSANLWDWPNYDKTTVYLLGNSYFTDKLSLNSRLYYDSFYNNLTVKGAWDGSSINKIDKWAGAKIDTNNPYVSIYDDWALGGIFTLGYEFDERKNLKVGLNLRSDTHKDETTYKCANGVSDCNENDPMDINTKLSDFSTSIFAEYTQRVSQLFRFALNGSYDRNDMLKAVVKNTDDKTYSMQGWTLQGIAYADLSDWAILHLNIGKKSKLPTLKERYSTTWGNRTPNPNLAPESALNYEIGANFDYQSTKASIAVFYNDINDMLISVEDTSNSCNEGSNCTKLTNAKEGYSYGAEIALNQGFWQDRINLGINYSYVQRKATNKDGTSYGVDGSRILDYPNHIANVTFLINPWKPLDVIANATYQSPQWYTSGKGASMTYAQNNDIFLLDLKLNYRVINGLQLSLGAYNLLDRNYYYGAGYYMAGRRVFASIEYKF